MTTWPSSLTVPVVNTIPRHGRLLQELAQAVKDLIADIPMHEPVMVAKRLDSVVDMPALSAPKLA
jgi:hypothetical protein